MMRKATLTEVLRHAANELLPFSESPRLDAQLLLGKVLGLSRSTLIAEGATALPCECQQAFSDLITRRKDGVPVAYLTGTREFWSMELIVTPAVLVPRPETETVVELALEHVPKNQECSILDLGTGSGAIALAIACERPRSRITGIDVSPAALGVAIDNSRKLGLTRIDWRLGSWFDAVPNQRFDLIVANPPYVASIDPILKTLSAEPTIALASGPTGLEALESIIEGAAAHLNNSGGLILEHGSTQAEKIASLLRLHGFMDIRSHPDFSGKPRVTRGAVYSQH